MSADGHKTPPRRPTDGGDPILGRIYAAGAGVVERAHGEVEELLQALVARGVIAERDGKRILAAVPWRGKPVAKAAGISGARRGTEERQLSSPPARRPAAIDDAVMTAMSRLSPATHADLADLDRRLKAIERKIDRLAARGR